MSPALAALRIDPAPLLAPQAGAARAASTWAGELERYGAGTALSRCAGLASLFAAGDEAAAGAAIEALREAIRVMRDAPLAQPTWRHFTNVVLHSLALAARGSASLSLALIDGPAWTRARTPEAGRLIAFQPGELHVRVLAGTGTARIVRNLSTEPSRAVLEAAPLTLRPGLAYALEGAREALAFDAIEVGLVTLRLHRGPATPGLARQYDLATGALVHQAAGERRDSRAEMIMALCRAMNRADAAPAIAARTREGEPAGRWQAVRECLALDAETGLRELVTIASASGDPLAVPARALLETLVARDPGFARAVEALLCPA
ncbi:MAG TPA: hypothetical protein VM055_00360 [Novosphingobium sp.]|nr:hypothetical protein [Novosphingobium sp.]